MTDPVRRTTTMNVLHVAIGLAIATGLPACKIALSGPMAGQTAFVTDKSSSDAWRVRFQSDVGGVATPDQPCPDPWPIGWPHRNNGNSAAFSDHSFRYERC